MPVWRSGPWMLLLILGACQVTPPQPACSAADAETDSSVSRLFLEQVSSNSALVSWRGPQSSVCVSTKDGFGLQRSAGQATERGFQARLTKLEPDTTYRYVIEGPAVGGIFRTAPERGHVPRDGSIRLWILGDSGSVTEVDEQGEPEHPGAQASVRDAFFDYLKREAEVVGNHDPIDLMVLLGDNAYPSGTEDQWQTAYFEMYPQMIRSVATVPTIGNHEMGTGAFDLCTYRPVPECERGPIKIQIGGASNAHDPATYDSNGDGPDGTGLPYLNIFTLPTQGEWGGVPSHTEQYYSLDYGNVHVVSLDSQLSVQDPEQLRAMRDWLERDLSANTLSWTIVIFHHPPFSKGENHDSDLEVREIRMRETFVPLFDRHRVDAVFSGHAHSYERSWYIGGHTGFAASFDPARHVELNAAGDPASGQGEEAYPQTSVTSGSDDKVVYTVAGSAGKAGHFRPCELGQTIGCTKDDWLDHPAHRSFDEEIHPDYRRHGIARLGSVLVEATEQTLTSKFIDHRGEVLDHFELRRTPPE